MKRLLWPVMATIIALAFVASLVFSPSSVQSAPQAVPTPLAYDNAKTNTRIVRFYGARRLTADNTQCVNLLQYDSSNVQIVIDQGTAINTTTIVMLYSGDGVNYTTGPTLVNANTQDYNDIVAAPLFMRDTCLFVDVEGSDPVTITANLEAN